MKCFSKQKLAHLEMIARGDELSEPAALMARNEIQRRLEQLIADNHLLCNEVIRAEYSRCAKEPRLPTAYHKDPDGWLSLAIWVKEEHPTNAYRYLYRWGRGP